MSELEAEIKKGTDQLMCLEVLKHQERWWFFKLSDINKGTGDNFSDYKTISKVLLSYLEVKLNQATYD